MQQEKKPQSGAQQPVGPSSAQAEGITSRKTEDEGSEAMDSSTEKVEEDEDGMECGFCLFMKGGGCKESFTAWEKCVEDAEKGKEDIVEKCFEVTGLLKKCMEAHADYYEPILRAEKAMEEEARQKHDQERVAASGSQATPQELDQIGSFDSPASEGKEARQELDTANDRQSTSEGPEQKGPSRTVDAGRERS